MSHYWPGSIFHLSVCWLAQPQACSSPEPGERWCRGYTRSLPSPPQKLCDTSPPASSLCSPASKHKTSSSYLFTVYLDCCWHLYLLLTCFFFTCVIISLAKTLFPCSIIMLMNLLKNKDKNHHLTWTFLCTHLSCCCELRCESTWWLGHQKQSLRLRWWLPWWAWGSWARAVPSPLHSAPSLVGCRPPCWLQVPDNKGCICSISPGTLCKQMTELSFTKLLGSFCLLTVSHCQLKKKKLN